MGFDFGSIGDAISGGISSIGSSANSFLTGNNADQNPISAFTGMAADPAGQLINSPLSGQGLGKPGSVWNYLLAPFKPPSQPDLQAAGPAPTQASAAEAAIPGELKQEHQSYLSSSYLTGGQGLLDQPTTASRTLLGY